MSHIFIIMLAMRLILRISVMALFLFLSLDVWAKVTIHNKFVGISGDELQNVVTRLELDQKTFGTKLDRDVALRFINQAPSEINKSLQPYGYFRAAIKVTTSKQGNDWYITYNIKLGKPLHITSIDIKILGAAANNQHFKKYLEKLPLKVGDQFNTKAYNDIKQKLFNMANHHGYLAATMQENLIKIDLKKYTCDIIMHFQTGPQYYFGPSYFHDSIFSEKFLRRFLRYKAGDAYSEKKLQKTQEDFNDSGLFRGVIANPEIKSAKNLRVPINYHVLPLKSQHYIFGAGFGTDTGPRGLIGISLNNLTKTAHSARLTIQGAEKQAAFQGDYVIPGQNPATDRFDLSATGGYQKQKDGKSYTIKAAPAYMTSFYGWQQIIKLNLQREWYKVENKDWQVDTLLYPSINWIFSKGNDPIRPTKGYKIALLIQGAKKGILSPIDFAEADLQAKIIQPLIKKQTLLVLRGEIGITYVSNPNLLPLSLRFSAGGAQSIRGFAYQSIGPGTEIGVGSAELRQRIVENWYLAAFYDAGYAANRAFHDFHQGLGGGVVWLSPVGAMELTYAIPLHRGHVRGMIQFSMGPEL